MFLCIHVHTKSHKREIFMVPALTLRPTWPEQRIAGRPVSDFVVIDDGRAVRTYRTNAPTEDRFLGALIIDLSQCDGLRAG